MKPGGNFFSWFATFDSGAASIFQRNGASEVRTITGITDKARTYLQPLIRGEAYPPYGTDGLPKYVALKNVAVKKKLPAWEG